MQNCERLHYREHGWGSDESILLSAMWPEFCLEQSLVLIRGLTVHYFSLNERFGMKGGIHEKAKQKICDENNGCCYTKKVCLRLICNNSY